MLCASVRGWVVEVLPVSRFRHGVNEAGRDTVGSLRSWPCWCWTSTFPSGRLCPAGGLTRSCTRLEVVSGSGIFISYLHIQLCQYVCSVGQCQPQEGPRCSSAPLTDNISTVQRPTFSGACSPYRPPLPFDCSNTNSNVVSVPTVYLELRRSQPNGTVQYFKQIKQSYLASSSGGFWP